MSDQRKRDPVGEYLAKRLARTEYTGKEPAWRPSVWKIASLCIVAAAVAAVSTVLVTRGRRAEREWVVQVSEEQEAEQAAGRVVMVRGEVTLVRGRASGVPEVGDEIVTGDLIESREGAAFGMEHAGHTIVLVGEGRLSVRGSTATELRVGLERGVLAARTARQPGASSLRIEGLNAEVVGRGAVFTVEAVGRSLERTTVADGEVTVLCKRDRKDFHISRSSALDMRTWTARPGSPDTVALEELAAITDLELAPEVEEPEVEEPPAPDAHVSSAVDKVSSLEHKVRQALDEGDMERAVDLIELEGKGRTDAGFLLLAADVYRQAGLWLDAVGSYLAAAGKTDGKKAERALLRAAEIHLRKLKDPGECARILDEYMQRFPGGFYMDEALYLGGAAHAKLGDYEKARGLFARYLAEYPKGLQTTRVHLSLARILASRMHDCTSAMVHVKSIKAKGMSPAVKTEVQKLEAQCAPKGQIK
jgi:hypothetical protein